MRSAQERQPIEVATGEQGYPRAVWLPGYPHSLPILCVLDRWREWIGVLDGEPERDVWLVELPLGVCELHHVNPDSNLSHWLSWGWKD